MTTENELTNLLPRERLNAMRRTYFIRLATIAALMASLAVFVHAAMLVPTYVYIEREIADRTARSGQLDTILSGSGHQEVNARLTSLASDATYLERLASTTSGSAAVRDVLTIPRNGVVITAMTFTPGSKASDNTMTLAGIAPTREALRQYVIALSDAPSITTADLPINAYAKETNIDFIITLTGTLTP